MKHHRWKLKDAVVTCKNCLLSIKASVRPRRVTACPPTWFEKECIETISYGDFSRKDCSFKGLMTLPEEVI